MSSLFPASDITLTVATWVCFQQLILSNQKILELFGFERTLKLSISQSLPWAGTLFAVLNISRDGTSSLKNKTTVLLVSQGCI